MKNHVVVMVTDRIIVVDGVGLQFDFPAPNNLWSVQWHEGQGYMQFTDDWNHPLTESDYEADVAPWVRRWEAEKARLETEANRPPTPEEEAEWRLAEINARLAEIDAARSRPLADLVLGIDVEFSIAKLQVLEDERAELATEKMKLQEQLAECE
ncbi:MAG: hypothetical protein FWG04_04600 [Desulfovibrionaceae bacterium]|nr:hypothetical protein [Desulfovibrionaceae bacterium]